MDERGRTFYIQPDLTLSPVAPGDYPLYTDVRHNGSSKTKEEVIRMAKRQRDGAAKEPDVSLKRRTPDQYPPSKMDPERWKEINEGEGARGQPESQRDEVKGVYPLGQAAPGREVLKSGQVHTGPGFCSHGVTEVLRTGMDAQRPALYVLEVTPFGRLVLVFKFKEISLKWRRSLDKRPAPYS